MSYHSLSVLSPATDPYFQQLIKSNAPGNVAGGSIKPPMGMIEPDDQIVRTGLNARGIREKYFNLSFNILREIARRVVVVGSIQNLRCMQLRPFGEVSYNDDDVGFRVKLKKKDLTPTRVQKKEMEEIEEFIRYSGYANLPDAEDREGLPEIIELATRELLTIDQVAISLRRNRRGKLLDYFLLDAATVYRTVKGRGYEGDKSIKYVQQIDGHIIETFTHDDMIFYYMNRVSDIRRRGYGYSYIEASIDIITAWLFGMSYNKEVFNSSSMPKGIISFEGEKLNQNSMEDLQRQWVSMFRGVKGMWRTPFLQHAAKWTPIAPNNRDMEFNQYIQMLASWICAIHGVDAQELGIRLNQAQSVLNENQEAKVAYSKDRGLRNLASALQTMFTLIMRRVPEWDEYKIEFTGTEVKNQSEMLDVDNKQVKTFLTVNEKRAEKDLKPIEGGDVILDPQYIQHLAGLQAQQQPGAGGPEAAGDQPEGDTGFPEWDMAGEESPETTPEQPGKEAEPTGAERIKKSMTPDDYIEIIL